MKIIHNTRCSIKKNGQIFYRVRYSNGSSVQTSIDFSVAAWDPEKWDSSSQRPKRGTRYEKNGVSIPVAEVINKIDNFAHAVEQAIVSFEMEESIPEPSEFKKVVNAIIGRKVSVSDTKRECGQTVSAVFNIYIDECKHVKFLAASTINSRKSEFVRVLELFGDKNIRDVSISDLQALQKKCVDDKLNNTSTKALFNHMLGFFRWAVDKGYPVEAKIIGYKTFLRTASNDVIFLSIDDIEKLMSLTFKDKEHELSRDVFVFQCSTGLRYSDVCSLTESEVVNGVVSHTMIKVSKHIKFRLNQYAQQIADKYRGATEDGKLLPALPGKSQNKNIKAICKQAKMEEPVVRVSYVGNERIEKVMPKYKAISTHTGRRTFVSVSLKLGATASQVTFITGHSTVDMMQKYVGYDDEEKSAASTIWDNKDNKTSDIKSKILSVLSELSEEELLRLLSKK